MQIVSWFSIHSPFEGSLMLNYTSFTGIAKKKKEKTTPALVRLHTFNLQVVKKGMAPLGAKWAKKRLMKTYKWEGLLGKSVVMEYPFATTIKNLDW